MNALQRLQESFQMIPDTLWAIHEEFYKSYPRTAQKADQCCKIIFDSLSLFVWVVGALISPAILSAVLFIQLCLEISPISFLIFQKINTLCQRILFQWPRPFMSSRSNPTEVAINLSDYPPEVVAFFWAEVRREVRMHSEDMSMCSIKLK